MANDDRDNENGNGKGDGEVDPAAVVPTSQSETLLGNSSVRLYGRKIADITIAQTDPSAAPPGPYRPKSNMGNNFLQQQLSDRTPEGADSLSPQLARIYSFSYAGRFFDMSPPAIFLVHGEGDEAERREEGARASVAPDEASRSGVSVQDYSFSTDIRVWTYDKNDFSLRLDAVSGMLEDILIQAELAFDSDHPSFGGGRVSGGRVSGGRVSGGRVSGGRVSGGRVSGSGE